MRLDLSSHITFERVSKKYYRPENAFEEYNLARFEKSRWHFRGEPKASCKIAKDIVKEMEKKRQKGKTFVLGISGEHRPWRFTRAGEAASGGAGELPKHGGVQHVRVLPGSRLPFSNLKMLKEVFLNRVDIDPKNIYSPDATIEKHLIADNCEEFEKNLEDMGASITCSWDWVPRETWASTCREGAALANPTGDARWGFKERYLAQLRFTR